MGVTVTTRGSLPRKVWDVQASKELGVLARTSIVTRTFQNGLGVDDKTFKPYSTTPLAFAYDHPTARRIGKAGLNRAGEPMYGHAGDPVIGNPMRAYFWSASPADVKRSKALVKQRTRTKSARGRKDWVVVGRRFPGGYAQLKRGISRGSDKVNLTVTGQMQRDFRVKQTTLTKVVLGMNGAAPYAEFVHRRRPWFGLSPRDVDNIESEIPRLVEEAMARSTPDAASGNGGSK